MNLLAVLGLLCFCVLLVVLASFSPWLFAGCGLIGLGLASRKLLSGWLDTTDARRLHVHWKHETTLVTQSASKIIIGIRF